MEQPQPQAQPIYEIEPTAQGQMPQPVTVDEQGYVRTEQMPMAEPPCKSRDCWPRSSYGMVILVIFNLAMLIVVVILLFVVDLPTNQIASTALIALTFIFTAVYWFMTCECGSTRTADGGCVQAASCGFF